MIKVSDIERIDQADVKNKTVLVRVDFNVPIENDLVVDATRIEKSIPTIEYLLKEDAKIILVTHRGRPKGTDSSLSLAPVVTKLQELLPNIAIQFYKDDLKNLGKITEKLTAKSILLIENIRFHSEETSKEKSERKKLADQISKFADVYVNEAFGASHRAHSSIVEMAENLPRYAGFLLDKEIRVLSSIITNAEKPVVAIIGGAKISSKIEIIEKLIPKVNTIIIGGAMAYTFLKSRALSMGNSMLEKEYLSKAFQIVDKASMARCQFLLPDDHIVADEFSSKAKIKTVKKEIPDGFMGMDIGPKTIDKYSKAIKNAKTVFWNGPMGVFEIDKFAKGTNEIAKAVSKIKGVSIVGGGDSVHAIKKAGLAEKITHISTGGGASLEFLEGKEMPGLKVLIS